MWNSPESKKELARITAEVAAEYSAPAAELSVAELLLRYLRHAQSYYVKDGNITDEVAGIKAAMRPVRELYSHLSATQFGPTALKAVQQQMVQSDLSRRVVNKQVGRIRRMFRWAVGEGMIPADVLVGLEAVAPLKKGRTTAREKGPVLPVDDAVVEMTLRHLNPVVASMVRVQRLTGMRPNEVVQLRPADLDRSNGVWQFTPGTHKTEHHGRGRVIAIGPKAQTVLAPFLHRDPDVYCFSPAETVAGVRAGQVQARFEKGRVAGGNRKGKKTTPKRAPRNRYDTDSYRRAVERGCEKAGTEVWTPNRLRHAAATEIRARFGIEAVRTALGHSDIATSLVYAERDQAAATEIARLIG